MALLRGEELRKVVEMFERRGVHVYHACQLKDFKTYSRLGGIPSRGLMERSGLAYTAFQTDGTDRTGGMWSKVFGNLSDFGLNFSRFKWVKGPIPNPYGPILLVANPNLLLRASDVAICLRSAGAHDFNREAESLGTVEEVERLFAYAIGAGPNDYANAYIKFSDQLKREFAGQIPSGSESGTLNPEISCTVETEFLPFESLDHIIVDAHQVNGLSLCDRVQATAREFSLRTQVWLRRYKDGRIEILNEVGAAISSGVVDLGALAVSQHLPEPARAWAQLVLKSGLDWQYSRFATYLREGTLSEMGASTS